MFPGLLYNLKNLRVTNFEDFCLALKILLSKILVLQRYSLKSISSQVIVPGVINILSMQFVDSKNYENFIMKILFLREKPLNLKISNPRKFEAIDNSFW